MRITPWMEQQQFLYNLENINTAMQQTQEQLSTGKTLNLPQDDPVAVSQDMELASETSEMGAGLSTVSSGLSWMNATETALQGMISQLQQIQSNVVAALNTTNQSQGGLAGYAATISQLVQGVYQIADQKLGDRYLFGGQAWDVAPSSYTQGSGAVPSGADQDVSYQIVPGTVGSSGVSIDVTVTAYSIFKSTPSGAANDLQQTLDNIVSDLQNGDVTSLQGDLNDLNANLANVVNINADLGGRIQRMTSAQNLMQQYQTNLTNLKGGIEGADMAQVMTQFSTDQVIYEAALQMGAQILLPSLVNYLPS
ncbi:flagellin [Alicyclobacillus mali (ex Roth et al. 2021)]|uniref:flagellin N-terminal helical domain-containing protein n=1 Tax=Alicyclobacillus mali (ex Roth et al. 2021) TaxID=1123961 RepID=UPI001A8F9273|nr:flagellin [Alicyclobacillus mali (ex Roth et al. 2021)]